MKEYKYPFFDLFKILDDDKLEKLKDAIEDLEYATGLMVYLIETYKDHNIMILLTKKC